MASTFHYYPQCSVSDDFNPVPGAIDRKLHVQNISYIHTCTYMQLSSALVRRKCRMAPHACMQVPSPGGQPSTRDTGNELHPGEHGQHRLASLTSHDCAPQESRFRQHFDRVVPFLSSPSSSFPCAPVIAAYILLSPLDGPRAVLLGCRLELCGDEGRLFKRRLDFSAGLHFMWRLTERRRGLQDAEIDRMTSYGLSKKEQG